MSDTFPVISVSAVVFTDPDGRVLLVRKRNTSTFMLPGGKGEAGESPADTAIRESHEEVGVVVDPAQLTYLGHHRAAAANEPDHLVDARVYRVTPTVDPDAVLGNVPESEIAEVRWVDLRSSEITLPLAPLLTDCVWPMLAEEGDTAV